MNAAQIEQLAEDLRRQPAPQGIYNHPEIAGRVIGNLQIKGDALAIAALTHAQDDEVAGACVSRLDMRRLALEWIALRGVQVPA